VIADKEGTLEEANKLGLTGDEFKLICDGLSRPPTFTELAMFSGMWSEHCSYKNSILLLKDLYAESDRLLAKPGEENAGALRINAKQAVVFKVESHNHPSALEPYQGAATGVGGIMRDIFTMGARPLVTLNSLRFGDLEKGNNRTLFERVVKGIGDYGNSLGIACAGGEVFFHSSYSGNPLVNAMTVGIAPVDKMASAKASGIGNLVMYVGAKTGRDGIHGASFASKNLSKESEEERSAVQVGDPFMEKLLMEASLKCIHEKLVVAIQDMGAAGLVSSSSEMAASGGVGIRLNLEKVPAREESMEPFEFMLSESQERMLMVVTPDKKAEVEKVFAYWGLEAAAIGEVTESGRLDIAFKGELYASVPAAMLAKNAPRYKRETVRPSAPQKKLSKPLLEPLISNGDTDALQSLLENLYGNSNFASRSYLYEQFDTDIGNCRAIGPGCNAGVYNVPGSEQALAVSLDGNGFYVGVDPYLGSQHTVAEGIRNVVSSGATPIGITNCLNFANPYIPENYFFFENAVKGMSDAAQAFSIPVTGGNVSFYNESELGPVLPTPTIGTLGLLDNAVNAVGTIVAPGLRAYILGDFKPTLGCSLVYHALSGQEAFELPELDLFKEIDSMKRVQRLIQENKVNACIDLAAGGLLHALLKSLFSSAVLHGFNLSSDWLSDMSLIGETAHSYLIFTKEELPMEHDLSYIGTVIAQPVLQLGPCAVDLSRIRESFLNGLE
jgi:phosphoribosylformylglycinamidine synthase subunit PurL